MTIDDGVRVGPRRQTAIWAALTVVLGVLSVLALAMGVLAWVGAPFILWDASASDYAVWPLKVLAPGVALSCATVFLAGRVGGRTSRQWSRSILAATVAAVAICALLAVALLVVFGLLGA